MSADSADRLANQLLQTTQKLARIQARRLLREQRVAMKARMKERRSAMRRRLELGDVVIRAGFGEWSTMELLGLLLEARDHFPGTPETLTALRQRAERFLSQQGQLVRAERSEHNPDAAATTVAEADKDAGERGDRGKAPAWLATTEENSS